MMQPDFDFDAVPDMQDLSLPTLQALKHISHIHRISHGEVLFLQHDFAHSFYVVQSGGVRLVEYTADGQAVTLKIYGPGEIFGLLAISGSYPYPAQAEAIQDSVVIAIPGEKARHLMHTHPDFAVFVVDCLVCHVHIAHSRIRQMSTEKVERRLARALLQYCAKFGRHHGQEISIDIPLSQQAISEFIGTTVETVNRLLKTWESQKMVRCSRKHLDILNEAALIAIAEEDVVQI